MKNKLFTLSLILATACGQKSEDTTGEQIPHTSSNSLPSISVQTKLDSLEDLIAFKDSKATKWNPLLAAAEKLTPTSAAYQEFPPRADSDFPIGEIYQANHLWSNFIGSIRARFDSLGGRQEGSSLIVSLFQRDGSVSQWSRISESIFDANFHLSSFSTPYWDVIFAKSKGEKFFILAVENFDENGNLLGNGLDEIKPNEIYLNIQSARSKDGEIIRVTRTGSQTNLSLGMTDQYIIATKTDWDSVKLSIPVNSSDGNEYIYGTKQQARPNNYIDLNRSEDTSSICYWGSKTFESSSGPQTTQFPKKCSPK